MADILQTIERYRALGIDQQIDYKKRVLDSLVASSVALSMDDENENYLIGPYEVVRWPANLTSSNDNLTGLKAHDLTGVKEAILAFCAEWHSVTEIAQYVHRSKQYIRGEVLPLIKDKLEMLYPDNTSHPKQKYRVKR